MKITFTTLLIVGTLFCANLDAKAQTLEQRQKIMQKRLILRQSIIGR
jgi:hypothetical protein